MRKDKHDRGETCYTTPIYEIRDSRQIIGTRPEIDLPRLKSGRAKSLQLRRTLSDIKGARYAWLASQI